MTTLTDWGGEVEVCIGLARTLPGGLWDESLWDESEWEQADTALGDWLDVTCDTLDPIDLKAGSSDVEGVITRWEAATCSLGLHGAQYDPRTGQWAGLLAPGLPVRVRWRPIVARTRVAADIATEEGWSVVFVGMVADGGYNWDPIGHTARLDCNDLTTTIVGFDQIGYEPPVGAGEIASVRIDRLATLVRVDPERRDITAGGVALQADDLEGDVWGQMLDVADTDLGLLWVRRDGRLSFRPEGRVGEVVPVEGRLEACPAPGTEGIHYVTLEHASPNVLRNWVTIARGKPDVAEGAPTPADPPKVTIIDDPSVARFKARYYNRTDLLHSDDAWSRTLAEAVIANGAWPSTAPVVVEMDTRVADDVRIADVLLSLEPEHVFTVVDPTGDGSQWRMITSGWDVELGRVSVAGSMYLSDVTGWALAGDWDDAAEGRGWDEATWALSGISAPSKREEPAWQ